MLSRWEWEGSVGKGLVLAVVSLLPSPALFPWDGACVGQRSGLVLLLPANLLLLIFCMNVSLKRCCREMGKMTHSMSHPFTGSPHLLGFTCVGLLTCCWYTAGRSLCVLGSYPGEIVSLLWEHINRDCPVLCVTLFWGILVVPCACSCWGSGAQSKQIQQVLQKESLGVILVQASQPVLEMQESGFVCLFSSFQIQPKFLAVATAVWQHCAKILGFFFCFGRITY